MLTLRHSNNLDVNESLDSPNNRRKLEKTFSQLFYQNLPDSYCAGGSVQTKAEKTQLFIRMDNFIFPVWKTSLFSSFSKLFKISFPIFYSQGNQFLSIESQAQRKITYQKHHRKNPSTLRNFFRKRKIEQRTIY